MRQSKCARVFVSLLRSARETVLPELSSPCHAGRDRNLSGTVDQVATAIGFDEAQSRYFLALVEFNQAEGVAEQNEAFEKVAAMRRFRSARRMGDAMFTYLSHWYYPAIREMAATLEFREDPAWIAARLVPQITPEAAQEAVETLEDLGMLVRGKREAGTR